MSTLRVNNVAEAGGAPVITSGVLDSGSLPAGSVLQVVSTTKTDTFSSSSTSYVDITGLAATITPRDANSKILVSVFLGATDANAVERLTFRTTRNGTAIGVGDSAGSRIPASAGRTNAAAEYEAPISYQFLDSPASTSALTYQVQGADITTGTFSVNKNNGDADSTGIARYISTITLMEIAG